MTKGRQESDLPFGSEFSPSQIELPGLLEIVQANQGNPRSLESAILAAYFIEHGQGDGDGAEYNRSKLANNCKLGMIAYGLITRDARFTDLGQSLYELRDDPPALYA